ncbi:MAG TPA: PDZ domain-containing protein [Candidatus Acidoferrales bacterium]|nr:PDZ domain-containing protein [Candidatus Acidoferrales bacterium]
MTPIIGTRINQRLFFLALLCFAFTSFVYARKRSSQQGSASPRRSAVSAPSQDGLQIQFAFQGNVVQVPAQIADALPLVPVRINGSQPSWFLLDTARANSAIDDVRAVAVGLYSPSAEGTLPKSFSNVTLEFPGLKISLPSLALDSFGDLSARIGHVVQGVLGEDVLSRLVLKIDYQAPSVQFYDPQGFKYGGRGLQVPLQISGGIPAIAGKVAVKHRGKFIGLMAIATAQTEPLAFSPHFAAGHSFSELSERMLPLPGADAASDTDVREFLGRVQELQFGKIGFADPIAIFPVKSAKGPGIVPSEFVCAIGGEVLSRFSAILNYPAHLLILEPNQTFPDVFTADMSGLTIIAIPPAFDKFEVAQVARKSPAAAAHIEIGDMIQKIDDRPASDYNLDEIRELLRQSGIAHKLSFLHNGKPFDVTLTLKPLV